MAPIGCTSGEDGRASLLVVDDEPLLRHVVSRLLCHAGYAVHQAGDGQEALDMLKGQRISVDCVISDIVMPHVNGVQLLADLTVHYPDVPVILMSAYDQDHLRHIGFSPPCAYLVKPFANSQLLREVERCLNARAA